MTSQSIYCTVGQHYARPERFTKRNLHKRSHAPDGGPSGRCTRCMRATRNREEQRRKARIKADPERYAAFRARENARNRERYAKMTPEQKLARSRKAAAYTRTERARAKRAAYQREYKARDPERVREQARRSYYRVVAREGSAYHARANARRKARRFAQRLAAAGVRAPRNATRSGARSGGAG
jgi:hypothetical protein